MTRYVQRFTRTERTLHWVNAICFLFLLATGLVLYLPVLSQAVARRELIKTMHFWGGIAWISLLILVAVLGNTRRLLQTARELETFAHDRFNAGQKVNAILSAAFAILFLVSGLLLWFGERDTRFRFASTVTLHDALLYVSFFLLVGHLYLAVIHPATRHALRGMTRGSVREEWARRHYPNWEVAPPEREGPSTTGAGRT